MNKEIYLNLTYILVDYSLILTNSAKKMYIVFGSKKNVYKSVPMKGIEIIEKYNYKFFDEIKLELSIAKVIDKKSKIKVIDCNEQNCENLISVKFFGNFKDVDDAKKEIESLIYYGSLKTKLEKIS